MPVFEAAVVFEVFGRSRENFPVPWYTVAFCAGQNDPVRTEEGLTFDDGRGLAAMERADTIIVPGCADFERDPPGELLDALRVAYDRGARIASICTGAFTLAAAGLLDGRRATTHWMHGAELALRWPAVQLDPSVLYVQDGQVFTSAGECAGLDLCLHLVQLDHGSRVANTLARRMVMPPHRDGGQAQYIDQPLAVESSSSLASVLDWARSQLHQPLSIGDLADQASMSRRSFLRHFRSTTGTTPLQWMIFERVTRACDLLETTNKSVEIIAQQCGFGTAQSLRSHFVRIIQVTPNRYRQRFQFAASSEESPAPGTSNERV